MRRARLRLWIVLMFPWLASAPLCGPVAKAQQSERPKKSSAPPADALSAWLHEVDVGEASGYEFFLDADQKQKLELRREPILRWSSSSDYRGEVFVWTYQGRAAVVGCIFSAPQDPGSRQIMHEFHSLAARPLVVGRRGGSGWQPEEAGITLEPVPGAPPPAGSRLLRLVQMRELASRFGSHVDRRNMDWELRLLTQPLYRYETRSDDSPVVDGAVFGFVWTEGTDPEVLLVLEAVRTGRELHWRFAPVRFTNRGAWVAYQGREVWRVDVPTAGNFDGTTNKRYGAFSVKSVAIPDDVQRQGR